MNLLVLMLVCSAVALCGLTRPSSPPLPLFPLSLSLFGDRGVQVDQGVRSLLEVLEALSPENMPAKMFVMVDTAVRNGLKYGCRCFVRLV